MTSIPRFPADASAHDVAGALTTAGAAIIEGFVPESLVDELLGQMHPFIEATPFGGDDFVGRRTKRTGVLPARSVASRQFIAYPLVLAAMGPDGW